MDSTSIQLPGSTIAGVTIDGDTVRIRFEPAYLIKTMTGSVERTRCPRCPRNAPAATWARTSTPTAT